MAGFLPILLIIPFAAYLLGSIPFGVLFTRLFGGGDVRKVGSGNIGATNVARAAGPIPAILTLLFDFAKGAVPVWLAGRLSNESATWMMIAALAALLGHCFPIWLKFRGGKGVATAAGAFLVLCPPALLGSVMLFLIVLFFWRYVSLASISAAAAMPLLIYLLWAPHHAPPLIVTFGALAAAVIIIYKHDANIQRLVQGEESKFSLPKKRDAG
jgi:glycerol-3-phosphate acyltransferase PlsY